MFNFSKWVLGRDSLFLYLSKTGPNVINVLKCYTCQVNLAIRVVKAEYKCHPVA